MTTIVNPHVLRRTGVLTLTLFAAVACGRNTDFKVVHTVETSKWTIPIEAANSAQAYGPSAIRVRRVSSDSDVVLYEGEVANDGAEITLDNIRPDLRSDTDLRLCLNGVEQTAVLVRINPDMQSVVATQGYCE